MAEEPKIDGPTREEGRHTEAPENTEHRDTEPAEDIIPHSAKAISDYHDGLKDLTHAFKHHHGELLKEMKKHHGAMEHMTLKKHYGNWIDEHEEANKALVRTHEGMLDEMGRKFKKYHPDLEPLEEMHEDDSDDVPSGEKPTKEPRAERSEREDTESHRDTKTQPATAPAVPVTAAAPPVETKTTPSEPDELSDDELLLALGIVGQLKKESKQLRQDFQKAVG